MVGKRPKVYPGINFQMGLPTHYANESEPLKLIVEVILPYMKKQRESEGLPPTHKGLIVQDVPTGQMTPPVKELLNKIHLITVNVPPNMTKNYSIKSTL